MYQKYFHPWSLIPVDRAHAKYILVLIKNLFLRDGEHGPNLGELCVPRNTLFVFIIFSEMYSGLHGRNHKYSLDHTVGFDLIHFVFLWTTKFLSHVCEDCPKPDSVWRYGQIVRDQMLIDGALCRSRNKFPRAGVRDRICVSHLRTWCTVLIPIHRDMIPRTQWIHCWTICSEIHRAARWAGTRHCWRPMGSHGDQISRKSRFYNDVVIFSSLLFFLHLPLWHGSRVVNLIASMAARKHGIAHNVEQTEMMVPSRVTLPSVTMSASWLLVSTYLIRIIGSKLIQSNNQSGATLWVRDTNLIVGILSLIIILITTS